MKYTKRILLSLLAGLMTLTLLAACDNRGGDDLPKEEGNAPSKTTTTAPESENEPAIHFHKATNEWYVDGINHWKNVNVEK